MILLKIILCIDVAKVITNNFGFMLFSVNFFYQCGASDIAALAIFRLLLWHGLGQGSVFFNYFLNQCTSIAALKYFKNLKKQSRLLTDNLFQYGFETDYYPLD